MTNGAPSPNTTQPSPSTAGILHEVLSGRLGARYGALPIVPMPQEGELLIGFVQSLAHHLKGKGLYRRDRVVMLPDHENKRMRLMSDNHFCSWSQQYVVTSKERRTKDGEVYPVIKDMPTEAAAKTLESDHFVESLGRIDEVHGVPQTKLVDGELVLMEAGYDESLRVFTFDL